MSSYEDAPATRLLATKCAVCGRPLVDAQSVEIGVGPECRKRNGLEQDNPNRTEANKLVHKLALFRSRHELAPTTESVVEMLARLGALGYVKLRDVLTTRLAGVTIRVLEDYLEVRAPFKATAKAKLASVGHDRFVSWHHSATLVFQVHASKRQTLWAILKEEYPGTLGYGPMGPFAIKERAKALQTGLPLEMT